MKINIPTIAREIDEAARAQQRPIAHLQALRAAHKQRRSVGGGIFRTNTTSEKSAYHFGGRSELQFNIGRDEHGNFRYGIGLSTQPSRDFQDVTIIYPLMDRLAHALATTRFPPEYELHGDLSDKRPGKFVFFGKSPATPPRRISTTSSTRSTRASRSTNASRSVTKKMLRCTKKPR